ncbi:hypothetical protein GCM10009810_15710 [Nostocoides vanveenii]|uniref:Uncharacterized protein n=1 Tax=Nostocoides vanveenii TaxID=330835 RepID=A0ABN2KID8_9MICO
MPVSARSPPAAGPGSTGPPLTLRGTTRSAPVTDAGTAPEDVCRVPPDPPPVADAVGAPAKTPAITAAAPMPTDRFTHPCVAMTERYRPPPTTAGRRDRMVVKSGRPSRP